MTEAPPYVSYPFTTVRAMNPRRLWQRIQKGNLKNVRYEDFERMLRAFGWTLDRQRGSHRVFRHPSVGERLNVQPDKNGQAKPYQLREFVRYVKDYDLHMEER